MIFLDNASTTRPYESVLKNMMDYSILNFYNPSSLYTEAYNVRKAIDEARNEILASLNASDDYDIIFCGSASEANNLALSSGVNKSKKLVVSIGEHPSVYETAKNYKNNGIETLFLPLDKSGIVDKKAFLNIDFENVSLISIMHVSNETGAINDIKELCKIAKQKNPKVLFHSDGVQAFGKIDVDLLDLNVDYYTISAHKIHGPKGIGALIFKKNAKIKPIIFGGGQENGRRSGTENVCYILAFKECAKIKNLSLKDDYEEIKKLKAAFINELKNSGLDLTFNSDMVGSPYILSFSIKGLRGEVLTHSLEEKEILIGTGSACSSKKIENRVLNAMGRTQSEIEGNVRLSFSVSEIGLDVKKVVSEIVDSAKKIIK